MNGKRKEAFLSLLINRLKLMSCLKSCIKLGIKLLFSMEVRIKLIEKDLSKILKTMLGILWSLQVFVLEVLI